MLVELYQFTAKAANIEERSHVFGPFYMWRKCCLIKQCHKTEIKPLVCIYSLIFIPYLTAYDLSWFSDLYVIVNVDFLSTRYPELGMLNPVLYLGPYPSTRLHMRTIWNHKTKVIKPSSHLIYFLPNMKSERGIIFMDILILHLWTFFWWQQQS